MGLDTVELVMAFEETFGVSISDAAARNMRTAAHVVDYVYPQIKGELPEDTGCLAFRAFYRLRRTFKDLGCRENRITPQTKVSQLLPEKNRRDRLTAMLKTIGFTPPVRLPFGLQYTSVSIRDLVLGGVVRDHHVLRTSGCGWSRRQVREVVRSVMKSQLGLKKFSDNADIVRDLGAD